MEVREESDRRGAEVVEALSARVFDRYLRWDRYSVLLYVKVGGRIFVAREGETALGGAFLRRMGDGFWELTLIGVFPEYRGRGVGKAILRKILEEVPGEIYLHVEAGNTPAINLYLSFGFEKVRKISRFYSTGEDAYLMVLKRTARRPAKASEASG